MESTHHMCIKKTVNKIQSMFQQNEKKRRMDQTQHLEIKIDQMPPVISNNNVLFELLFNISNNHHASSRIYSIVDEYINDDIIIQINQAPPPSHEIKSIMQTPPNITQLMLDILDQIPPNPKPDNIKLTPDTIFSIFNSPEIKNEEMRIILQKISNIVFSLEGGSTWNQYSGYDFFMTWNVLNNQPYVSSISCSYGVEYSDIRIDFKIKFKNNQIILDVTEPILITDTTNIENKKTKKIDASYYDTETKKYIKKTEEWHYNITKVESNERKLELVNQCLDGLVTHRKMNNNKEISIVFATFSSEWRDYWSIPCKIKKISERIYDKLRNYETEIPNTTTKWMLNEYAKEKYGAYPLVLSDIKSEYKGIEFDFHFSWGIKVKIPSGNIYYNFGINGCSKTRIPQFYLESCYNHTDQIKKEWGGDPGYVMTNEEINRVYDLLSGWITTF